MQLKHLVKTLWRRLLCALVPIAPEVVPFRKATAHRAELQGYHEPEVLERELPRYPGRREALCRRRRKHRERPKRELSASQRPRINVRIDIDIS